MSSVTIPLDPVIERALDDIAARGQRSREAVVAEALASFIRDDAEAVAAIRRGMDDARGGRVTTHEAAMRRLRKAAGGA